METKKLLGFIAVISLLAFSAGVVGQARWNWYTSSRKKP